MRLYILLTIYLVDFIVYFAASLSANRHEDQDKNSSESLSGRANESYIIMNAAQYNNAGPENNKTDIKGTRKEERTFVSDALRKAYKMFTPSWDPVKAFKSVKVSIKLEDNVEFFSWLNSLAAFLEDKSSFDAKAFIRSMKEILKSSEDQKSWYAWLLEIPKVKDEAAKEMMELARTNDKEQVFETLALFNVRPDNLFRAMELRHMLDLSGAPTTDHSLQRWFEYLQTYMSVSIKGSKRSASETFANEELLTFLVGEIKMMNEEVEESFPVHEHSSGLKSIEPSTTLLEQVVNIIDSFRFYPELEGFVNNMLTFMVLKPSTRQPVLESWSKSQRTPISIFNNLRLGDDFSRANYANLLTVWLQHVSSYCKDLASEGNYVLYAHLLSPTTLNSDVKKFFQSKEMMWMLNDIKRSNVMKGTGNLLKILEVPWHVKEWLDSGMTPLQVLQLPSKLSPVAFVMGRTGSTLTATKTIGSLDVDFGAWLSFVDLYKQNHKEFTIRHVLVILKRSMSNQEVRMLFQSAQKVPSLKELATEMLIYLYLIKKLHH